MRKNLWKAVAVTVVLALVTTAVSALAADKQEKPAPCPMSVAKAAPAQAKGCAMTAPAAGAMQGCGGCCCMRGGAMRGCRMAATGGMAGAGMGPGAGMGCGMGMGCDPAALKGLDLTAEQQRKVTDIHERMQRKHIQADADLRLAQMDLHKLVRAESPDRAKIEAQIDRIARLEADMHKARVGTQLEVRSLLTPEQLKKLQAGPAGCTIKVEKTIVQ
jgi:Spy/CpxP family protein refolding chaperone